MKQVWCLAVVAVAMLVAAPIALGDTPLCIDGVALFVDYLPSGTWGGCSEEQNDVRANCMAKWGVYYIWLDQTGISDAPFITLPFVEASLVGKQVVDIETHGLGDTGSPGLEYEATLSAVVDAYEYYILPNVYGDAAIDYPAYIEDANHNPIGWMLSFTPSGGAAYLNTL